MQALRAVMRAHGCVYLLCTHTHTHIPRDSVDSCFFWFNKCFERQAIIMCHVSLLLHTETANQCEQLFIYIQHYQDRLSIIQECLPRSSQIRGGINFSSSDVTPFCDSHTVMEVRTFLLDGMLLQNVAVSHFHPNAFKHTFFKKSAFVSKSTCTLFSILPLLI